MTSPAVARILFVHHRNELGGAPASLSYLLRELDRTRFEAHVYCPPGPAAELFRSSGATVHTGSISTFTHIWASTYHGRRWLICGRELQRLPRHLRELDRVLRAHRFQLVHLNDSPLVPAALLARAHGVPVVWHLRSSLPEWSGPLRSRAIRVLVRRLSAAAIAITSDVAASFDVDALVVPNSVDLERFRPGDRSEVRRRLGLPDDRAVVSFFGFLYPSKGFHDFIQAASLLHRRGVEATFMIVGGPVRGEAFFRSRYGRALTHLGLVEDHEQEVARMIRAYGLGAAMRLIPFTRETADIYRASDVVVAPSRGPELGRPVLEGSACGCAIVASGSRTGAGVVIPDVTGMLVPRRSPAVLAGALEQLVREPERRLALGAAARTFAEEHFEPHTGARRVMALYESVLAGRGRT